MRFSSHHVAGSRSGLSGSASASIAFDAAGSLTNASVSSASRRSASDSFDDARAGEQVRHRRGHVQPPRDPRERRRPCERIVLDAELAPQPIVERRLLAGRAGAQRFQIAAILAVVAARDVDQDVERLRRPAGRAATAPLRAGRRGPCRGRAAPPPAGRRDRRAAWPGRRRCAAPDRCATRATPRAAGPRARADRAGRSRGRACSGFGSFEQRRDGVDGSRAARLQAFEPDRADVDRRRAQRRDLAVDGRRRRTSATFDTKPFGAIR